jgi:hypothetical protein
MRACALLTGIAALFLATGTALMSAHASFLSEKGIEGAAWTKICLAVRPDSVSEKGKRMLQQVMPLDGTAIDAKVKEITREAIKDIEQIGMKTTVAQWLAQTCQEQL